jgi:RNA polymerase sigma factor (sigma-70 family)
MGVTLAEPNGSNFSDKLFANDLDLITRIKEDEREASDSFYRWLYGMSISRFMKKYRFDYEEAKELASEVVLKTLQSMWQYDPEGGASFVAWIFSIIKHKAIDVYRQRKESLKNKYHELFIYELYIRNLLRMRYPEYEDEILREIGLIEEEDSEDKRLLDEVFGKSLSEDDQFIILCKLSFGTNEAARKLGITVDAAKKRYRVALRRLQRAFFKARGSADL